MENIKNLFCEMQVDFLWASKNTRTNAPSGGITRNHSLTSARALWPKVYYACTLHAVYNLQQKLIGDKLLYADIIG